MESGKMAKIIFISVVVLLLPQALKGSDNNTLLGMNGRLDKWPIIANRGHRCVTKNQEKHFTVVPCTTIHL